jgi:hypothetical protein
LEKRGIRTIAGCLLVLGCAAACAHETTEADDIRLARQVVTSLTAGRSDEVRSHFNDVMDASLSSQQLSTLWERFTTAKGAFVSAGAPTAVHVRRVTIVSVPVQMSKEAGLVRVFFDSDGKINGLYLLNPGAP